MELLRWMHDNGCHWDEATCSFLAENGQLEDLQRTRSIGCPWDERTCKYAAKGGHDTGVQGFIDRPKDFDFLPNYTKMDDHLHLQW
jgi:hypothetical protein